MSGFNVNKIRAEFPILSTEIHGKKLAYLDNAATSQKPRVVLDTLLRYYEHDNANIHRAIHTLSQRSTEAYENARKACQRFVGAAELEEVIFVRGATEGINLVAQSYGRSVLKAGDELIVTTLEHHSNIVPWQMLCEQTGASLKVVPVNDEGELLLGEYQKLLSPKTKLVAFGHISNALGTENPVKQMTELAHKVGAKVLVDGAQAAPHSRIDVLDLDCDFYVFSGHKVFGPTGIGVLYGKKALLESMPPYQGGGDMIETVRFSGTTYNALPFKFEAGTPNIAGALGLASALQYVESLGFEAIARYEQDLLDYGTNKLKELGWVRLVGTAKHKASVLSFVVEGCHPQDIAMVLDREGIAIRTGHHCAQPLMERLGLTGTCRASFSFYNTFEEIDRLVAAIEKARGLLV